MKKSKFPEIITENDVESIWTTLSKWVEKRKKSCLASRLALWIGTILFFATAYILLFSLLYIQADMSNPEDIKFFSVFSFLYPILEFVKTKVFTFLSLPWYAIVGICVVGTYLISLLIAVIAKILVGIFMKPCSTPLPDGSNTEKARALAHRTENLTGLYPSRVFNTIGYPQGSEVPSVPNEYAFALCGSILFTLASAATLIYAISVVDTGVPFSAMIVGFVICAALYWLVSWLLSILNSKLLASIAGSGRSIGIHNHSISERVDAYWLANDEEEKERRKEAEEKALLDAQREKEKKEAAEEKGRQLSRKGLEAEGDGDYDEAERCFRASAELGNPDGAYNYARYCLRKGDRSGAIRYLKKAMEWPGYNTEESRQILEGLKNGANIDLHLD